MLIVENLKTLRGRKTESTIILLSKKMSVTLIAFLKYVYQQAQKYRYNFHAFEDFICGNDNLGH